MSTNQEIAKIFREIAQDLEIKGSRKRADDFKILAYKKAATALEELKTNIQEIYEKSGIKGIEKIKDIGKSTALKIEEFLKEKKISYYEELKKETAIQQVIAHFFQSKGVSLEQLKKDAKKRKIVYSRFTKPAKQLLELAGSLEEAKKAIDKVASWATTRNLDYSIETIFKKWLELDRLKPKEVVKKPFYDNMPMEWSQTRKKWYVISDSGEWLEFADKESKIEWRIIK